MIVQPLLAGSALFHALPRLASGSLDKLFHTRFPLRLHRLPFCKLLHLLRSFRPHEKHLHGKAETAGETSCKHTLEAVLN